MDGMFDRLKGHCQRHMTTFHFLTEACVKAFYSSSLLAALTLFSVGRQSEISAQSLLGLWGGEYVFGPAVRGPVVIDGRQSEWLAHIAGFQVPVHHTGKRLSFAVPEGQGEFQGQINADGRRIHGHWIQPTTVVDGYPFWTPVELESAEEGLWSGPISPLDDKLTVFLVIAQSGNGSVTAFIRSPENNFGAHRNFDVQRDGDKVVFANSLQPTDRLIGVYNTQTDRLSMTIPKQIAGKKTPLTLDFTRRTRNAAVGFYPRTPAPEHYVYRKPLVESDGWAIAPLADVGLNPAPVVSAVEKVLATETRDSSSPYLQGLVVARHGKLALEEYFYGFDSDRPHDLRSAGKSFTSASVGIAIDHGAKFDLDTPVVALFPEYKTLANPDPRKQRITVKNLLTMTSGLAGNDSDDSSPGNELRMFAQHEQPDFYKFALDLPMAAEPGGDQMVYFTAGINLLGGIIRNTVGMPLAECFEWYLAIPLNMKSYHLNLTPTGEMYGGGGLYLRPRDALKLGQLYLNGGTWNGRRVVSKHWVDLSTKRYSGYNPEHGYGFAWHLFEVEVDNRIYSEYEAQGNGGQVINVLPELDMTVMFTTGNYGDDETVPEREILTALIRAARPK